MSEPQATLIDVAPTSGSDERPKRATSKGIGAGDIVLVDKKGRRFHALVTELEQLEYRPLRARGPAARLAHLVADGVGARGRRGVAPRRAPARLIRRSAGPAR